MGNEKPEFENRFSTRSIRSTRGSADLHPGDYISAERRQTEWGELPASQDLLEFRRIFRLHKFLILRCVLLGLLTALVALISLAVFLGVAGLDIGQLWIAALVSVATRGKRRLRIVEVHHT